ncbi:potassium-transporting ATPase subunit F [Auraticoccus monumenti]
MAGVLAMALIGYLLHALTHPERY